MLFDQNIFFNKQKIGGELNMRMPRSNSNCTARRKGVGFGRGCAHSPNVSCGVCAVVGERLARATTALVSNNTSCKLICEKP